MDPARGWRRMTLRSRPHIMVAAAGAAFTAAYYALIALGSPRSMIDALLVMPAGAALLLHARALDDAGTERVVLAADQPGPFLLGGRRGAVERREFLGTTPARFRRAAGLPARARRALRRLPGAVPGCDGAAAPPAARPARAGRARGRGAHLRRHRLRLPAPGVPAFQGASGPAYSRFFLVGLLAACWHWSPARWRWSPTRVADHLRLHRPGRAHLRALNSVASGFALRAPARGSLLDLAWIVPFVLLAAAAVPCPRATARVLQLAHRRSWPAPARSRSTACSACGCPRPACPSSSGRCSSSAFGRDGRWAASSGCCWRSAPASACEARSARGRRSRGEPAGCRRSPRSARRWSRTSSGRWPRCCSRRAGRAPPGRQVERVIEQAHRAQEIVRGMVEAFRLARPAHRQAVDVGLLLEEKRSTPRSTTGLASRPAGGDACPRCGATRARWARRSST